VREKHKKFCNRHGIEQWIDFDKSVLEKYGNWLGSKYADRTVFFELTLLKSVTRWLVEEGHLPAGSELRYSLRKPQGTDTYCYRPIEVTAMISHCRKTAGLGWLVHVIVALVHTGLRISELAGLRWSDVNLQQNLLTVADERSSAPASLVRLRGAGLARSRSTRSSGKFWQCCPVSPTATFFMPRVAVSFVRGTCCKRSSTT
jgi:integrase